MPTDRITKRVVDAAKPAASDWFIWDSELAGFGLRIWPSGRRTFVAQYRVGGGRGGRARRLTIGTFPKLTVEEARSAARNALAKAQLGHDAALERERARDAETVNQLIDLWLTDAAHINRRTGAQRSSQSIQGEIGRIEAHIRPLLGARRLADLHRSDVEKFRDQVARGVSRRDRKTKLRGVARVRGGNGTATRTVRLLASIFAFGVDRRLLSENPARGVRLVPGRAMNRFLSEAELGRLGAVLQDMEVVGASPYAVMAIRLLALTGARRSEITGLRWSNVDLEHSMLRLQESKTGAKIIPLAPPAVALINAHQPNLNSPFLFPATSGKGHIQNLGRVWATVRLRAELPGVRLHDLRHTFASFGAARGFGLPVIGALLGHRQAATTQRYAHLADDPLKAAAHRIGTTIAGAMTAAGAADENAVA
jgi:integrase